MYPPDGVLKDALDDQGPEAPAYTARTRHVCGASNSSAHEGVYDTVSPSPATVEVHPLTTAPAAVLISNSYDNGTDELNLAVALFVVSVRVSGCAPLTGEIGDGAVAFSVEPSAAAFTDPFSVTLGEDGLCDDFEQAMARASTAAAEQRTNLFWCIR
jgi:hypothetical protein